MNGKEAGVVRVLVVEDSAVARQFLHHVLEMDSRIQVVGTAEDGAAALEAVKRLRPDVITMDIHMPRMDGYEASRRIMETTPTPIVIVSGSTSRSQVVDSFRALETGALAVLPRPVALGHDDFEEEAQRLRETVRVMAEVRVVRRWPRRGVSPAKEGRPGTTPLPAHRHYELVVIGASTGGPVALYSLLIGLTKPFPLPILVVQHMATGFIGGFVDWLNDSTGHTVVIAQENEAPRPGVIYVAPDDRCMRLDHAGRIKLIESNCDEPGFITPSVSDLFKSVLQSHGANVIGILLSGMGRDGAAELKALRDHGAFTMVQDKESCTVFGMPGEAVRLGAADVIAAPEEIARKLDALARGD